MSDSRLISADSHFVEPPHMWAERLDRRFRDRAPRVGRRVETPRGVGVVTGYNVLDDACTVDLEDGDAGIDLPIDACREVARSA